MFSAEGWSASIVTWSASMVSTQKEKVVMPNIVERGSAAIFQYYIRHDRSIHIDIVELESLLIDRHLYPWVRLPAHSSCRDHLLKITDCVTALGQKADAPPHGAAIGHAHLYKDAHNVSTRGHWPCG